MRAARKAFAAVALLCCLAAPLAAQPGNVPPTPQNPPVDVKDFRDRYRKSAHALIVGNAQYTVTPPWTALNSPASDATALRQLLEPYITIDPGSGNNLTLTQMKTVLLEFAATLMKEKPRVAVIYFSGHGITVDGQGLLLPVNAPGIFNSDFLKAVWSVDKLLEAMAQAGVPATVLILDACRNVDPRGLAAVMPFAQYASALVAQADPPRQVAAGLPKIDQPRGVLIAYATAAGDTASDGAAGQHSQYSAELLQTIGKPLPVQDIISAVSELVEAKSRKRPWTSQVALNKSIYINPPDTREEAEYGFWMAAKKAPQTLLRPFLRDPAMQHSVYRAEALALERQLVADGSIPPDAGSSALSSALKFNVPAGRSLAVRSADDTREVAWIPAYSMAFIEAGSLFGSRMTVLDSSGVVGTVAPQALSPAVRQKSLGFELKFRPRSAELEENNAGDYLKFVEGLRNRGVAAINIATAGDSSGDNARAAIRAVAVQNSLQRIDPALAAKVQLSPRLELPWYMSGASHLVVMLEQGR